MCTYMLRVSSPNTAECLTYEIVQPSVNECLTRGEVFASISTYKLFFKNTKSFLSCRNPEALKSQEEKVGKMHSFHSHCGHMDVVC